MYLKKLEVLLEELLVCLFYMQLLGKNIAWAYNVLLIYIIEPMAPEAIHLDPKVISCIAERAMG